MDVLAPHLISKVDRATLHTKLISATFILSVIFLTTHISWW